MRSRLIVGKGHLRRQATVVGQAVGGAIAIALLTIAAYFLHFELSSAGFLDLLVVVLIALAWGFWQATVTSLIAVLCLNYFFTQPVFSFYIAHTQDWVALGVFEITALIVSGLSARNALHVQENILQQQNIEMLYELSRSTLLLNLHQPPGSQIVQLIRQIFNLQAVALYDPLLGRVDKAGDCGELEEKLARGAYLQNVNHDDQNSETLQRALHLGVRSIGGLALRGSLPPAVANALASLTAIALERYRSFTRETHAEAAQQSEELRTAVLDALAHAFKTPLTAIRTASSGMLEIGGLSMDQYELAGLIDQQSIKLNELTTRLLQTARLKKGELRVQRDEVVVASVIDSVLQERKGKLFGHPVEVKIEEPSLKIQGDSDLVATIVSQFVDNAAKYSSSGSTINIAASRRDSEIVLSVHNEGPTIPIRDRDKIFQRFYRCSDLKDLAPGTGIGLSIAKKAADAQHGHVWVISGDSEGTTFFLSLPHAEEKY
jgi:two-component system sensor histidine kinase KdpD